jgi:glycosyltransferase involved in cell wall biosynthesis
MYSDYYGLGFLRGMVGSYLRRFHNRTDLTFVPTQALLHELRDRSFERLHVLGRGVDAVRFSPQRRSDALRRSWGAADDDPVVLHVGRLAAEKNVGLVIRAFAEIRRQHSRARLVMVGDGPQRSALERAGGPSVVFTGTQRGESLAAHYASADVFLFPSLTDTFGNVTLEALASGLLVVSYRAAAASVHVTHGVNGLLAEPGNETRFIELASRAVAQLDNLRVVRVLARRTALASSWDSVLGQFENVLQTLRSSEGAEAPAYAA